MAKSPRKKSPPPAAKAKAAPKRKAPPASPKAQPKAKAPPARKDRRGTPKGKGVATQNGGRIGNPPHCPTAESRKLANDLSAYGLPHWAVAELMEISEDTLERHYAKEIALGPHKMTVRAANMVAKGVLAGDKDYVKFWLARRGGEAWTNKQSHEHSGPQGRPIEHRDMTGLTDAQLAALAALDEGE